MWSARAHEAKNVFKCETHSHKWGRMQGMKPNDSQMHSHFGSCTCVGVTNVQSLGWKGKKNTTLGLQDTIRKVLKCRCLRCLCIAHLNWICMNDDQDKKWESNWEFDSQPQIPWKQESNEVQLKCVLHLWKDFFKSYKILPSHFKKLHLRKIWASKVLG